MLLVIDNILTAEELAHVRAIAAQASFGDGRATAGELAAKVKNNMQLTADDSETQVLAGIVHKAFHRNPLFVSAALPGRLSSAVQPLQGGHGVRPAYG